MISEAEKTSVAQPVHRESLGEMEQKRSYRRSTLVLALPRMRKMKRKIRGLMHDGDVDAQRGQQALFIYYYPTTYSRPEVRKRVIGSDIVMDWRLKTQRATAIPNAA
jgi:hypothetical protein